MNDEEHPANPPVSPLESTPPGTSAVAAGAATQQTDFNQSDTWVPRAQYDARATEAAQQRMTTAPHSGPLKAFYILLTITGLSLFILYMGMLLWPFEYISKGDCVAGFTPIAFWLNPVSYLLLLVTGIVGTTIKHSVARPLGIAFIVLSIPAWFLTGIAILGPILCGV